MKGIRTAILIGSLFIVIASFSSFVEAEENSFYKGMDAFSKHDFDSAITQFLKEAGINPQNIDALIYLGNCYLIKYNIPPALEAYRKAISINPDSFEANLGLCHIYYNLTDKRAFAVFQKTVDIFPFNINLERWREDIYEMVHKWPHEAGVISTYTPTTLWRGVGRVTDAQMIDESISADGEKFSIYMLEIARKMIYSNTFDYTSAENVMDKLDFPSFYEKLADAYQQYGERILKCKCKNIACEEIVQDWEKEEYYLEKALEYYRLSLFYKSDQVGILYTIAYINRLLGKNLDDSIELIERAWELKAEDKDKGGLGNLAWFYHLKGDDERALEITLKAAKDLEQKLPSYNWREGNYVLGVIYYSLGDLEEAKKFLNKALAQDTRHTVFVNDCYDYAYKYKERAEDILNRITNSKQ